LRKKLLYTVFCLVPLLGAGQQLSNLHVKTFQFTDSLLLDVYHLVPGSEQVLTQEKQLLPGVHYQINYSKAILVLLQDSLTRHPIQVFYRTFPFKSLEIIGSPPFFDNQRKPTLPLTLPEDETSTIPNAQGKKQPIKVTGTLSRGLQVGNSQNMTLNSELNLQMRGQLTDQIMLEAVLSDKNIPIQPEGYSQQINEFDQIYIRLYDSTRFLQMGDVSIAASNSYFMQFNRKVMGADLRAKQASPIGKFTTNLQASAAIAKGNFNRMNFTGIEGSQGPYPLNGANNETYIVVLAGTEKIYLDGELLERGEQADYVINYNTGELTFNPNLMITGNSRIIAEFEYSDKNYNRFLLYSQIRTESAKASFGLHYFTEGDAKNQQVNQTLTDDQKQVLMQAGDEASLALVPNYDSVAYTVSQILYKLVDTLVQGIRYDSILVYSTHADSAFYSAGFAFVGVNRGSYVQELTAANGKVFRWVAPVNGTAQGSYEPVQLLVAPQKKQLLVAKARFVPNQRWAFETEWAFSNKDLNTFSSMNDSDNQGLAIKNQVTYKQSIKQTSLTWLLSHEFTHRNFNPIERFRKTEFERDWNLLSAPTEHIHLVQSQLTLPSVWGEKQTLAVELLKSGSEYTGYKGSFTSTLQKAKFSEQVAVSFLNSSGSTNHTTFYRHRIQIFQKMGPLKLGAGHEFEDNRMTLTNSDTLLENSQKYSQTDVSFQTGDSTQNQWAVRYQNRIDFLPGTYQLQKASKSDDVSLTSQIGSHPRHKLNASFTWRNFRVTDASLVADAQSGQNLLSRLDHQWQAQKKWLVIQSFYEIGTGMENKKEYSYIEVGPGQGIYSWIDTNGNSIPELDEFEVSPFPEEANYLKIYIPTSEYIKVYSIKWTENVKLEPQKFWADPNRIQKFVARFNNNLNYRIQQKHTDEELLARLNPIQSSVADSSLISVSAQFRNTLSFNRNHRLVSADLTFGQQFQKSLLVHGFDQTEIAQQELNVRWNMTPEFIWTNSTQHQLRTYTSEYFTAKNYRIEGYENRATFQWQPSPRFRTSVSYILKKKENRGSVEQLLWNECTPEVKISSPKQGTLTINASVIVNRYKGDETSSVAYNLLEGYAPGENYRWTVQLTRNLNQFLRLSFHYQGRKPAELPAIHTGQVSVSAYF